MLIVEYRLAGFEAEAGKTLVELGDLSPGIQQLLNAGPRRMRLRINVKAQSVTWLAHSAPRLERGPVGHYHVDFVVVGMDIFLHGSDPGKSEALL